MGQSPGMGKQDTRAPARPLQFPMKSEIENRFNAEGAENAKKTIELISIASSALSALKCLLISILK
jgi:hypothetical protein